MSCIELEMARRLNPEMERAFKLWGIIPCVPDRLEGLPTRRYQAPEGWKLVPIPGSSISWYDLVDPQGRPRATLSIKWAFWDRWANMGLYRRFSFAVTYVEGDQEGRRTYAVTDRVTGANVWEGGTCYTFAEWRALSEEEQADNDGAAWLAVNFPEYQDPFAYWE